MVYKFRPYESLGVMRGHLNLGGKSPSGERIDVTSLYFERGGKPWIGVMGEFHFSRCKNEHWYEELCKIKAGGVNIVSTYLFWNYHEEIENAFDFTGDRDIRRFVEECKKAGLDVFLRIGPWAHGECRNGGFPDWILKYNTRTNDAEYLSKVERWFSEIYRQIKGLLYKDGGNIIGVQLENELTDNPEHLAKLKEIAKGTGIDVPIYTVTGWNSVNGARIPVDEVVPVFGAYPEAPWEQHKNPLPPSPHYCFNKMRNDTAIGMDIIGDDSSEWRLPYERYPFATCELGGGIQVTHHRRPIIRGMDIYALSLVKLGSGNNLVGYYMYHGGTNKLGRLSTLNESRETGYPNDYPILSYDFQAPISEYGEIREQYRLLNLLHLFVRDFGSILAPMEAVPSERRVVPTNTHSLRYMMRTNGEGGFVFINHYLRGGRLDDIEGAEIDTGSVVFPPIDIRGGVSFFMPFNIKLGSRLLEYATAQPICFDRDAYFFAAIDSVEPVYKFKNCEKITAPSDRISVRECGKFKIITVPWNAARYIRRIGGYIYIGEDCDLYECDGKIRSVSGGISCRRWNGRDFDTVIVPGTASRAGVILRDAEQPGFAAKYIGELNIGGAREIKWSRITVTGGDGFVEIDFKGDAAQIYADGELVADCYYYGRPWRIPASMLYGRECYLGVSEMKDDFYREF